MSIEGPGIFPWFKPKIKCEVESIVIMKGLETIAVHNFEVDGRTYIIPEQYKPRGISMSVLKNKIFIHLLPDEQITPEMAGLLF